MRRTCKIAVMTLVLSLFAMSMQVHAQVTSSSGTNEKLSIEWQHYLPGISGVSVIQTSDGGYLALGQNASIDPSTGYFTNFTTVAAKTDSSGNLVWTKTYSDTLNFAIQTSDGYILAGEAQVGGATFVKTDSQGNILWQRNYTPLNGVSEAIDAIIQTSDGGYAMTGNLGVTEAPSPPEFGVMKVDSSGNLQWNITLSSYPFYGYPCSIIQTSDQGYVIVSTDYTHAYLSTPIQMFKLDSNGNLQWSQTYTFPKAPQSDLFYMGAKSCISLTDGFLIVGEVQPGNESTQTGLILKTDLQGNLVWNKTYTYFGMPSEINSISAANNGNLMFVGSATKETTPGTFDINSRTYTWVAQIDSSGNIQGQLAIDMGNHFTDPTSIIQTSDGGHVFVGIWNDTSPNGSFNQRFWIAKISNATPNIPEFPAAPALLVTLLLAISVTIVVYRKKIHQHGTTAPLAGEGQEALAKSLTV